MLHYLYACMFKQENNHNNVKICTCTVHVVENKFK